MSIIVSIIATIGVCMLAMALFIGALLAFGFVLSHPSMLVASALILMAMCAYYFTCV
jgi:hypothetical protein